MTVPFYKLHGAGNDILVVESKFLPKKGKPKWIQRFASRQLGVGADQVMEVTQKKPLEFLVWNGDGTRAEMCANGSRVLLFLSHRLGWSREKEVPFFIGRKKYKGYRISKDVFEISLGVPKLQGSEILSTSIGATPFFRVNVGNPHAVIFAETLPSFSFRELGKEIEHHSAFPQRTNVEFIRSWEKKGSRIKALVEVWERGAGATLSCGSGAVAVARVLKEKSGLSHFHIQMNQFVLKVRFEGEEAFLSGPSTLVAKGDYLSSL